MLSTASPSEGRLSLNRKSSIDRNLAIQRDNFLVLRSRLLCSRRHGVLLGLMASILVFSLFLYAPLPPPFDHRRAAALIQFANVTTKVHDQLRADHGRVSGQPSTEPSTSRYAYATFYNNDSDGDDYYFIATRLLTSQLLHAPETRTRLGAPFVVLVGVAVPLDKRERLTRDGATVIEAAPIDGGWIYSSVAIWQSMMTKFRLWELTDYEQVCYLDADTVLIKNLDGIFDDPATARQTTGRNASKSKPDEAPLPDYYVFAARPEMIVYHNYPPQAQGIDGDIPNFNYLNAGFFVLKPDLAMRDHYVGYTKTPDRFDMHLQEQAVLNYAHRKGGNAPWQTLHHKWNTHYTMKGDVDGGVGSAHVKWWAPDHEELAPLLLSRRWRMEGFFQARDQYQRNVG